MGQIIVRNLDDAALLRLKERAKVEGRSLEALVRDALHDLARPARAELIAEMNEIRARIGKVSGDSVDLIREDRDNDEPYR